MLAERRSTIEGTPGNPVIGSKTEDVEDVGAGGDRSALLAEGDRSPGTVFSFCMSRRASLASPPPTPLPWSCFLPVSPLELLACDAPDPADERLCRGDALGENRSPSSSSTSRWHLGKGGSSSSSSVDPRDRSPFILFAGERDLALNANPDVPYTGDGSGLSGADKGSLGSGVRLRQKALLLRTTLPRTMDAEASELRLDQREDLREDGWHDGPSTMILTGPRAPGQSG